MHVLHQQHLRSTGAANTCDDLALRAGVIKEARLVAQCMHRFCAACIEKWLRLSKCAVLHCIASTFNCGSINRQHEHVPKLYDSTSLDLCYDRENVCPQCRGPMQSRRDCKADPRFDRIISLLYDNVQQYEEQVRACLHTVRHVSVVKELTPTLQ